MVKRFRCVVPYQSSSAKRQSRVSNDPALAKGLVERGIVQIVTPGAVIDFDETHNNFIVAIDETLVDYAICFADVSTGDISVIRR